MRRNEFTVNGRDSLRGIQRTLRAVSRKFSLVLLATTGINALAHGDTVRRVCIAGNTLRKRQNVSMERLGDKSIPPDRGSGGK